MRIIFLGYHNVGHACLEVLIDLCRHCGDEIVAVVTPADDPRENLWFASVKDLAFANYLPVYQPRDPNAPEFVEVMRRLEADFLFSCYYRQMLKQPLLALPRLGALNLHGSLLPRYRGRCPVNWVLIQGETETGVTLHYMEEKPDKGDLVGQKRVAITPEDTAVTLFARMTVAAGALMQETYPLLRAGAAPRLPQDQGQASYFGGRKPADGLISWDKDAVAVYNLVRAVTHPYPGAFTFFKGQKLFIWAGKPLADALPANPGVLRQPGLVAGSAPGEGLLVATGQGHFLITQAQWEGQPEFLGPVIATWDYLLGESLGEKG
ncbi:MAG: formyltransferase [Deltaproteobacteria bacterium]|nr:formyltransferase [Deltaproteobacteria bacterium]